MLSHDDLETREAGCAGERMATEGGDVTRRRIVRELRDEIGASAERAERKSSAQGLCEHNHIWLHAEMFQGEKLAGAPETGEHFVENKQRSRAIAAVAQGLYEPRAGNAHAALGLDRFDHDRRDR